MIVTGSGYLAARREWFSRAEIGGLSRFVFNLAIPAMLFHGLATRSLPAETDWSLLLAFYLPTLVLFGSVMLIGRVALGLSLAQQGVHALGSTFGNTVFLGIPLIYATMGEEATLPLFLIISLHAATLFLLVSLTSGLDGTGRAGVLDALKTAARRVACDPLVIGLTAGLIVALLGWTLPKPVEQVAKLVGLAALPGALFVLGASLQRYRVGGNLPRVLLLVLLKNLVHPGLVWLSVRYLFSLNELWSQVAVIAAAMPTGVTTYLLAEKYGQSQETIASTVLVSTLSSVATLGFWLWLVVG